MKVSTSTSAICAVLLAVAPAASLAALATGVGTFVSAQSGRWLYYDLTSDQIKFGSISLKSPPATVFNISAGSTKGNYKVQVTDNRLYVSSGTGSSVAKGISKVAGTYNIFNFTQGSDGSFYFGAWNGAWAKTMYGAMDSSYRLAFTTSPSSASSAVKFKWTPKPYASDTGSGITYRTFSAGSTASSFKYNVSAFYPPQQGAASSSSAFSSNTYAYSVKWVGDAFQPNRPMLMYLGGSDSRTNEVRQETDVLAKTQSTGFPKVLSYNSTVAEALLKNYLVVVPASPVCYNTTTNSYTTNNCGIPDSNHFIKHYRPWELKRIYDEVYSRFNFDTTRFALVGTGMGGRGGLRFLLEYPTLPAAVSMVSGALETNTSTYIKALPYVTWDSGEGCWDVTKPNVGGECADENVVQPTMQDGNKLTGFPIRLWSSRYDDVDTLQEATDTCAAVNSGEGGNCTVIDTEAPNHGAMAYYSRDVPDVEWLASYQRLPGQNSQLMGAEPPAEILDLL
ncbi:unnamed protein product [Tilletia controversa]|uniref:Feruloyl esterase n=3 Tax=Tilletia TaxID=13289 RepID=A0A8X7MPP3_9BASI|nr:hypothetical protein CF336_g5544 [Tilletia laevis]KAE8193256.1 hypothetical protein CF328_g5102 [Tilletia controversa]KAE8257062.1 hypothetical protein A4X03_0g4796 [Tilletia caries]KAE8196803.1 hypothetical protein CF335_g4769 [Tilletia laevis]KAE8244109.1 hypothetical protein A4X06_0g5972 [Tilletia controversa]